jgi:hypothetical protein
MRIAGIGLNALVWAVQKNGSGDEIGWWMMPLLTELKMFWRANYNDFAPDGAG